MSFIVWSLVIWCSGSLWQTGIIMCCLQKSMIISSVGLIMYKLPLSRWSQQLRAGGQGNSGEKGLCFHSHVEPLQLLCGWASGVKEDVWRWMGVEMLSIEYSNYSKNHYKNWQKQNELKCLCSPHLGFVVFEQPFGSRPTRVVGHVQDHHALLLPANERTVRHSLHHGQEVLVAVVPRGHHGEGGPVVLLKHLEDDLELERGGAGELEVDGAAFLNAKRHTMNSGLKISTLNTVSKDLEKGKSSDHCYLSTGPVLLCHILRFQHLLFLGLKLSKASTWNIKI